LAPIQNASSVLIVLVGFVGTRNAELGNLGTMKGSKLDDGNYMPKHMVSASASLSASDSNFTPFEFKLNALPPGVVSAAKLLASNFPTNFARKRFLLNGSRDSQDVNAVA
jgi:hypothetical protein